jgi:hypothetical protein
VESGRRGEGGQEKEDDDTEFAKILDLNRSKRSVVRGNAEQRQPIWLRARVQGEGRGGEEGSPRVGWEV